MCLTPASQQGSDNVAASHIPDYVSPMIKGLSRHPSRSGILMFAFMPANDGRIQINVSLPALDGVVDEFFISHWSECYCHYEICHLNMTMTLMGLWMRCQMEKCGNQLWQMSAQDMSRLFQIDELDDETVFTDVDE